MKTAIPTDDDRTVGKVFGRAKSFAIHDSEDGSLTVVPNEGAGAEHGAGTGAA
ncbi:MAG: dinitrogenase iron-molybdenum cofactor biosynthesis protein, partial [Treponema sp.]|nr:dinitrogenase iron-molybdenum cofactor biosynthesis protein [Treponema sp.]